MAFLDQNRDFPEKSTFFESCQNQIQVAYQVYSQSIIKVKRKTPSAQRVRSHASVEAARKILTKL